MVMLRSKFDKLCWQSHASNKDRNFCEKFSVQFRIIGSFKQTRRLRKRERHLKMCPCVSAIIFQLFKLIMPEKCVLTILELNWNERLGHKRTKLNICYHMLTSSTQLKNKSFHVVERTRTSTKCQKIKNARAKRAKILFSLSIMQICGVFVAVVVVVALSSLFTVRAFRAARLRCHVQNVSKLKWAH